MLQCCTKAQNIWAHRRVHAEVSTRTSTKTHAVHRFLWQRAAWANPFSPLLPHSCMAMLPHSFFCVACLLIVSPSCMRTSSRTDSRDGTSVYIANIESASGKLQFRPYLNVCHCHLGQIGVRMICPHQAKAIGFANVTIRRIWTSLPLPHEFGKPILPYIQAQASYLSRDDPSDEHEKERPSSHVHSSQAKVRTLWYNHAACVWQQVPPLLQPPRLSTFIANFPAIPWKEVMPQANCTLFAELHNFVKLLKNGTNANWPSHAH